jgi:uncharacterized protein
MTQERFGPVPSEERILVIDCLRGAALFGILTANMRGFFAPFGAYFQPNLAWTWLPDRIVQAVIDTVISGKFITIFAALFGVGFAIQMERASRSGRGIGFYARRLAALLLIGIAHSFLLWWGDILIPYAVCGFALMLFRNRSPSALLRWALGLYWLLFAIFVFMFVATLLGAKPPEMPFPTPEQLQEATRIYADGSFGDIFRQRAKDWAEVNSFIIYLTGILGIFLFGLYLWKQGYLSRPAEHLDWWRRVRRVSLPIGLMGNIYVVAMGWMFDPKPMPPTALTVSMQLVGGVAVPALSLFYASTVILLFQNPVWQKRLQPFTYVGRMALTNYLLQSLICTTIFNAYGLGLFGKIGPLIGLPLTLAVYGLQVPFSRWWLSRHRYGPMEWVWRWMTYGRLRQAGEGN